MNAKNKTLAIVQIAVVLCSLFLVALPTIAADQETQKASTNTITTASEDDYVLEIYGNANEDDTIDMGDVVYTKLAIFGKKPKTELCDAKYDGRINVLDVIQTKLIILGKEKELTYIDCWDRIMTVKKPVKSVVSLNPCSSEALKAIGAKDMVVGVSTLFDKDVFYPELSKLPYIGSQSNPDIEVILGLNPDLIIKGTTGRVPELEKLEPKITLVCLELSKPDQLARSCQKLGYILDKRTEAKEFIDWYEIYRKMIRTRTEGLSEDEKTRVFTCYNYRGVDTAYGKDSHGDTVCKAAGGVNIAGELPSGKVDPEWVMVQNPDVIVLKVVSSEVPSGYTEDDPTSMKMKWDQVMSRPAWANIKAVKNERVYLFPWCMYGGPHSIISTAYCAKWFYPKLFEDLDPQAIHQEYLDRFQQLDYELDEHGVFAYPPIDIDGGLAGIPDRYKGKI